MATKSTQLTDPEYQARLEEAYQKLVESLDQRKKQFFDPTWLAAAQAFATPSKTGSSFETLGRVAGAVGKSQEEEAKRDIELNKAKFDINKELLALNQQQKRTQFGMSELAETPTEQPAAGALPGQPAAGALPGQPPVGGGALASAVGAAPGITSRPLEVATQGELPPFTPTKNESEPRPDLVFKPYKPPPAAAPPAGALPAAAPPSATSSTALPPPEDLRWGMTPAGRKVARAAFAEGLSFADSVKRGQEHDAAIQKRINDRENLRLEEEKLKVSQGELGVKQENLKISADELKIKQGQLDNAVEGTTQGNYKIVGNALVDLRTGRPVYIGGGTTLRIGNDTYTVNPDQADAYVNAARTGDTATVKRIGSEIMGLPGTPGKTPVKSDEQKLREKLDEEADRKAKTELKIERTKAEQKRQEDLVAKIPAIKEQKNDTRTLIEIFNKKEVQNVLGPTAKPGVRAAIGELVSGGLNVGGYQVAITNFDKAIVQVEAPKEVIDQLNVAGSLLRRAELLNSQTYLKGQGTVTNMERAIVQDINGIVYKDPPNALLYKSQFAYAQANMNERYIKTFQSWRDKNPDGTIEQFNRSKAYDTIESDYLDDLKNIKKSIGLNPAPVAAPRSESTVTEIQNKLRNYANRTTP